MGVPEPDLDKWRQIGDVEADAVVRGILKQVGGVQTVCGLPRLVGKWVPRKPTTDLPQEVVDYLHKPYAFPVWVDTHRLTEAQQNYQAKHTNSGNVVLGTYSLPVLYIYGEIALTLMRTGRLAVHTRDRLIETMQFAKVAMTPGSLNEAGDGWEWMRKVRLTHAITRAVAKLGKACSAAPGGGPHEVVFEDPLEVLHFHLGDRSPEIPLDQVELAFVLLTFSWVMVDGLAKLGVGMSRAEAKEHVYAWAVVGHMIGITDELLPGGPWGSVDDARRLFERIRRGLLKVGDPVGRVIPGAEQGRQLMAALNVVLVDAQRENIPQEFRRWARVRWIEAALQDLPHSLVRKLCGRDTARLLRVGRAPFLHWVVGCVALLLINLREWKVVVRPELRPGAANPYTVPAGLF